MKVSGRSNLEMLNNGGRKRRGRKRKPDPDVAAATGESNSIMKYLPNEITLDILSRLPIPSVLNCKLVCKNWRKTIQNPTFGNTHLRRALLGQQQLNDRDNKVGFLLLTLEEKTRIYNGYYFENRKSPEEIMELQRYEDLRLTEEGRRQIESGEYFEDRKSSVEFKIINHPLIKRHSGTGAIVGSCNGLVCISIPYTHHIDDPIYICNPTLGEQITLPRFTMMAKNKNNVEYKKTTYLDGHLVSGFGYNTVTNEYKVVRIHYAVTVRTEMPKGQVQVYTLGSGSGWRSKGDISYSLQRYYRCPTVRLNHMTFSYNHVQEICSPWHGILADGALHWLDEEWNIVAFELAEEEFSLLPSPPCFRPGVVNFFTLQILEGRLCVAEGHGGDQLDIWSFKKETSEWENMFSLSCHSDEFMDMYWPISLTLGGKLLLRSHYETLICYDPQTKEFKKQMDLITDSLFEPVYHDYPLIEAIPHMNSLVSLKALGEKPKAMTRDSDLGDHFYEYSSE